MDARLRLVSILVILSSFSFTGFGQKYRTLVQLAIRYYFFSNFTGQTSCLEQFEQTL